MKTFAHIFAANATKFSDRNALYLDGRFHTYAEMDRASDRLASVLAQYAGNYAVIFSGKSHLFFVSVLACLKAGKGYIVLNDTQSKDSISAIIRTTCAGVAIVEGRLESYFQSVDLPQGQQLKVLDQRSVDRVVRDDQQSRPFEISATADDCAYVFCTSGSTGTPKIVPITHRNLMAYLHAADERYDVDEHDRFTQISAITFDASIHDILFPWFKGASVYAVTTQAFNLVDFVQKHAITFWTSVPSISRKVIQMKQLTPACMPSLRHTMWVGEPLLASILDAWRQAAPNSAFENMYGPTEATVGITGFKCVRGEDYVGMVPIGKPYKDQKIKIVDEHGRDSPRGELLLGGSQVFAGYMHNPTANQKAFAVMDGEMWYRTGDLVKSNNKGDLEFLSRIDDQLKINGYRFERSEVEERLRLCAETQLVAVIPIRGEDGVVEGTAAFINNSKFSPLEIRSRLKDFMPAYMWPRRIENKVEITLNRSHKLDYKALESRIGAGI